MPGFPGSAPTIRVAALFVATSMPGRVSDWGMLGIQVCDGKTDCQRGMACASATAVRISDGDEFAMGSRKVPGDKMRIEWKISL